MTTSDEKRSRFRVTIPAAQKQQLVQAILTLLSVLVGIGLTLAAQVVTEAIAPEAGAAEVAAPHAVVTLPTGRLDEPVYVIPGRTAVALAEGDLAPAASPPLTITGVLTNVTLFYHQH